MTRYRSALLLLILGVSVVLPTAASADLLVELNSVVASLPFPGKFTWTYSVTATNGETLQTISSELITLYDFAGLVTVSGSWSASSSLVGQTPSGLAPSDDATITNVTFDDAPSLPSLLTLTSDYANIVQGQYAWSFTNDADGGTHAGLGVVGVPSATAEPPTGNVPEPATLILVGIAAGIAAVVRCRRP